MVGIAHGIGGPASLLLHGKYNSSGPRLVPPPSIGNTTVDRSNPLLGGRFHRPDGDSTISRSVKRKKENSKWRDFILRKKSTVSKWARQLYGDSLPFFPPPSSLRNFLSSLFLLPSPLMTLTAKRKEEEEREGGSVLSLCVGRWPGGEGGWEGG